MRRAVSARRSDGHLKQAAQIQTEKGAEAAGEFLLEHRTCARRPLDLFMREEPARRAAEVRHDQNRFEEAAELYKKARQAREGRGRIYAQIGRIEDAARCYLAAEKNSIAGEMFERAGQPPRGGRVLPRDRLRAARGAGVPEGRRRGRGGRVSGRRVQRGGRRRRRKTEPKLKELRGIAKKAGEILFKLERFEEAEDILVRAGVLRSGRQDRLPDAADYERAAELFVRVRPRRPGRRRRSRDSATRSARRARWASTCASRARTRRRSSSS